MNLQNPGMRASARFTTMESKLGNGTQAKDPAVDGVGLVIVV
jgi:hypothetical protein